MPPSGRSSFCAGTGGAAVAVVVVVAAAGGDYGGGEGLDPFFMRMTRFAARDGAILFCHMTHPPHDTMADWSDGAVSPPASLCTCCRRLGWAWRGSARFCRTETDWQPDAQYPMPSIRHTAVVVVQVYSSGEVDK